MMEINRSRNVTSQPAPTRGEQPALKQQLKGSQLQLEVPLNSAKVTMQTHVRVSKEDVKTAEDEAKRITLAYVDAMEKTHKALKTSLSEFEKFKTEQANKNPKLDLSDLDLYQDKEGDLKLNSGKLSASQITDLETALSGNEKLKDAFTQLHSGIVEGLQLKDSYQYADLNASSLNGSIRLNELTEQYSKQFHFEGFGQEYKTLSERLDVDAGLFGHFLFEAMNPKIRTFA
ncbi:MULTISPECIES: hypothetical protein [Pseudoalteromonas]|uniref:Uncharacterized protein n=1 Tax=Pseudoalteromonas luteoviolacea (strain 2ta16) TaxID=1353533 RepID=V4J937_PSEL2|nr:MULTISPECIES: hypothetical protein [Pseudoalteromonas]ESP91747.1 hypothetical protein PL2TA16_05388 [Pseudoalteromonas luteoviolacea 2ta16]MCG7546648.1 AsmA family protein [Pseudoalteromonas sp. Of7M-16]